MLSLIILGLLGTSLRVAGHPTDNLQRSLWRRTVDLNAFRPQDSSEYVNADVSATNSAVKFIKRESYVDTATDLVASIFPDVTFRVVNDHYIGTNGIGHVHFKQTVHGIDIDNADFNVNIGIDGTVFSYGNSFFAGSIPEESPLRKRDFSGPAQALTTAIDVLQLPLSGPVTAKAIDGIEKYVVTGTSGAEKDPEAQLVYYVKDGLLSLVWKVETDMFYDWLISYVDASTENQIHAVVNYVSDATYQVYPWGINDPTEGSRVLVTDPWDLDDSEFTWISDGTTKYNTTRGNNGIAHTNPSGGSAYLDNYRPTSATDNFSYPYDVTMTPPTTYRDASVTQLFYTANVYHDLLYELGFTEAAGNFEFNNNGQGGVGADYIMLGAQDGFSTNNAGFATPPDGQRPRMYMFIWTRTTPYRDCSFESGVVIHEFTHGVSNRLTGGPANVACLETPESGGMGEGWGDFMATAIRLKPADTRDTNYGLGNWVANLTAGGLRSVMYSTSMTTNPNVYTTLNTKIEVHDIGETWATMLYEVLWNLIDKYGKNDADKPTFVNGVPTDGKYLTMKLVIDGMALQPCSPNFVQARDAIVDADKALTGGANQCEIWTAFAKRGLGEGAAFGTTRTGSFVIPDGVC